MYGAFLKVIRKRYERGGIEAARKYVASYCHRYLLTDKQKNGINGVLNRKLI